MGDHEAPEPPLPQGFWAEAFRRATRNAVQAFLGLAAAAPVAGTDVSVSLGDIGVLFLSAGLAFGLSVGKSALGWRVPVGSPWYADVAERVAAAGLGAVLAVIPPDVAGLLRVDWRATLLAALVAMVSSLGMWALDPKGEGV